MKWCTLPGTHCATTPLPRGEPTLRPHCDVPLLLLMQHVFCRLLGLRGSPGSSRPPNLADCRPPQSHHLRCLEPAPSAAAPSPTHARASTVQPPWAAHAHPNPPSLLCLCARRLGCPTWHRTGFLAPPDCP